MGGIVNIRTLCVRRLWIKLALGLNERQPNRSVWSCALSRAGGKRGAELCTEFLRLCLRQLHWGVAAV